MNESTLQMYDRASMRRLLLEFPRQVEDAVRIGQGIHLPWKASQIESIVVTGLGGSAIGGDLLRSYLADQIIVPFIVNRHYFLPEFVDRNTLVVVSSYSGNTEETIAAHSDATKRRAKVICISSGGETTRMARKFKQPLVTIPKGYPPRAALGYSFFPLLVALAKTKFIPSKQREIGETVSQLRRKSKLYSSLSRRNPALQLAKSVYTKLPIIYSSADRFDAVNLRWRGQIAENAKTLAFGHVLPEMNHNELVGWKALRRIMEEDMVALFLRDRDDNQRVRVRMDVTKDVVSQYAARVLEVWSEGRSLLARMFSLIYLGDWMSFYLAILNGLDPTPVRVIDYLKNELAKVSSGT